MPPKKKPGSAGKGKKKAVKNAVGDGNGELDVGEKLTKAGVEIDVLIRDLEFKTDLNSRLQSQLTVQKQSMMDMEEQLETRSKDRLELSADMSRQYKCMQSEMASKINQLENQVAELRTKLAATQNAAQEAAKEHARAIEEKDLIIEDQNAKMAYMSSEFEAMLNDTLSKMTKKLEVVSQQWKENDNIHLSETSQRRLADFKLTRLALGRTD
ncbi:uncharacterized protein BJ171DRAFT_612460 [Polychytrium aggregatum]|uniref:uncharacterized protein n=1 Tax=Polychytrium aggregatum TaxID=110093 RepID=UPI0022FE6B02|nr:uncharacterized protein BJ171DRAFT_612460 [Polychytrium aggregatum]KAI9206019.1 hypothetical protein BJ171DRAFT_612460 [Polychytrium aggregatum]